MQQFEFPYEISLKAQMPEGSQKLLDAAEAVANAYSENGPLTGAALLLTDGRIVTGGAGAGACAERTVLSMHEASGPSKIKAIAVTCHPDSGDDQPPYVPCGACREAIVEAQLQQNQTITIFMGAPDGEVLMVEDAAYLLPFYTGRGKFV